MHEKAQDGATLLLLTRLIEASRVLAEAVRRTDAHFLALLQEHEALRAAESAVMRDVSAACQVMADAIAEENRKHLN